MSLPGAYPPKLQFAGHETFPLRQLWLRKAYCAIAGIDAPSVKTKDVFGDDAAIRRFGVGKNMVSAIRHWALACDVLQEAPGAAVKRGPIGDLLFGSKAADPYLERPATAWLVHWLLAGRAERSSTWFYVFNRVTQQTFTRASLLAGLKSFVDQRNHPAAKMTLQRDIEACLRCYLSRNEEDKDVDDAAEPLLVELDLISEGPGGVMGFSRGAQTTLPDELFGYTVLEFWHRLGDETGSGQRTLSFETIAHEYGSPGRVFKLDEKAVGDRLSNLEDMTAGALRWSDTAGVRQLSLQADQDRERLMQKLLRGVYAR